jgi:hypothetical protein
LAFEPEGNTAVGTVLRALIAKLEQGGSEARESLFEASELLRKASSRGFRPTLTHVEQEEIAPNEISDLKIALADYYENEKSAWHRRRALTILAMERVGHPDLRTQLVSELHLALQAYRVVSVELSELLLALDDIGELGNVDLPGTPLEHQRNAELAAAFLRGQGIVVPF